MGTVFRCTYYPKVFPAWVLLILKSHGVRPGCTHTGGNPKVYPSTPDLLQFILHSDSLHQYFSKYLPLNRKNFSRNVKFDIGDTYFLTFSPWLSKLSKRVFPTSTVNANTSSSATADHGGFPPPSWSWPKSAVAFSPSLVHLRDVLVRAVAAPLAQRQERWRAVLVVLGGQRSHASRPVP